MRYLLPDTRNFYKANLHTHTTISDGKLTPEEAKAEYKKQGYSILALTDHSTTVNHQHMNEPDFLMLTGTEVDVDKGVYVRGDLTSVSKSRHFCLIAKDPDNLWQPFRNPDLLPHAEPYFEKCPCENMTREYTDDCINALIAKANEKGFLVTYNHPAWSLENYADYAPMKGLWGVEYRNSASISDGYEENNSQVYQDLLQLGNNIMPVFADDTHRKEKNNGFRVLGASWMMVGAEKLEYASVIEALEQGNLYSSCGPEIRSIAMDGTVLRIRCSEAVKVQVVTHTRRAYLRLPQAPGETLTEVEVKLEKFIQGLSGDPEGFIRVIVTDAKGGYAVTRAYRMNELL